MNACTHADIIQCCSEECVSVAPLSVNENTKNKFSVIHSRVPSCLSVSTETYIQSIITKDKLDYRFSETRLIVKTYHYRTHFDLTCTPQAAASTLPAIGRNVIYIQELATASLPQRRISIFLESSSSPLDKTPKCPECTSRPLFFAVRAQANCRL